MSDRQPVLIKIGRCEAHMFGSLVSNFHLPSFRIPVIDIVSTVPDGQHKDADPVIVHTIELKRGQFLMEDPDAVLGVRMEPMWFWGWFVEPTDIPHLLRCGDFILDQVELVQCRW